MPVYAGFDADEVRRALKRKEEPSYMGTFTGAQAVRAAHVRDHAERDDEEARRRSTCSSAECPVCHGKRLRPRGAVGDVRRARHRRDVAAAAASAGGDCCGRTPTAASRPREQRTRTIPEKAIVAQRIAEDIVARLAVLLDLGLGYLSLERSTPTLSPGELQRLRLATQVRSNLFGVVYVLDEPSAGLHPADTEALLAALDQLKASGNSLFVVEHELDVIRHADWIVDVGPAAGEHGGRDPLQRTA